MKLVYAITLLLVCISLEAKIPTRMVPGHYVDEKSLAFCLRDDQGITHTQAQYLGKKVLLYFFNQVEDHNDSSYRRDALDNFLQIRYLKKLFDWFSSNNIIVIGISTASVEKVQSLKKRLAIPYILLSDPNKNLATMYAATDEFNGLIRTSILIDDNGIVLETSQAHEATTHIADILTYLLTTTIKNHSKTRCLSTSTSLMPSSI